ncbi:SPOR domain-containing protein [Kordiimonas aquimaris]|uniref:SPOR domain-containing protein n=1 Tax=Kordiimonas aquimaris TaxID=707591 RepID=UPI0021D0377B|nr:SPOR domain-containing protein [Kordiimonas aquimaris]
MKQPVKVTYLKQQSVLKSAVLGALLLALPACASQDLWQGQEVLVEARQEALEQNVGYVSEDHRELKDRFNALERLYVELVQHIRTQETEIKTLNAKLGTIEKDPQVEASVNRVRSDVTVLRDQLKKLENRVFSVEMVDAASPQSSFEKGITAPTGVAETAADANEGENGTPVSNTVDVQRNEQSFYGVHLASYRSKDQVSSGWTGLARNFTNDLQGLTPLIYVQSQEGIGSFMRLVAGPLINEQEADALCTRIKRTNADQYCRVAEYQGEPIE